MKPPYIIYTIIIIALIPAFLISMESDQRAYALRKCIGGVSVNGDGVTVDKEDIDICLKAYDKRTRRSYELQKAIKRPAIDKKTQRI